MARRGLVGHGMDSIEEDHDEKGNEIVGSINRLDGMQGLWKETFCHACERRKVYSWRVAMRQWM